MSTSPTPSAAPSASQPQMLPPPGFSIMPGTDGRDYLVPTFLVPATELAIAAASKRSELRADTAAGGVRT
jgi:hypothetical protein